LLEDETLIDLTDDGDPSLVDPGLLAGPHPSTDADTEDAGVAAEDHADEARDSGHEVTS
jgi:hypothetical protein